MKSGAGVAALVVGLAWGRSHGAVNPPAASPEATITSDALEMHDSGAKTFFMGHVVLTDPPYVLQADRMIQTRSTGVVDAKGHIVATWLSLAGERTVAEGTDAQYRPKEKVVELWGGPKITRWETSADTAPPTIIADRFVGRQIANEVPSKSPALLNQGTSSSTVLDAHGHVVATWFGPAGEKTIGEGTEGQYRVEDKVVELWGNPKITRWQTATDTAPFTVVADRFVGRQLENDVLAHGHVEMNQGAGSSTKSDEAVYKQKEGFLTLSGSSPVLVHWQDAHSIADFQSSKGFVWLYPKHARLMDHVHGHVTPL